MSFQAACGRGWWFLLAIVAVDGFEGKAAVDAFGVFTDEVL